ncbi:MAG TPA: hypothetical protein PLI47_12305 [Bacteroidia bacterium]|nr:hypothetical protein [Bacteroidia bacterium]
MALNFSNQQYFRRLAVVYLGPSAKADGNEDSAYFLGRSWLSFFCYYLLQFFSSASVTLILLLSALADG